MFLCRSRYFWARFSRKTRLFYTRLREATLYGILPLRYLSELLLSNPFLYNLQVSSLNMFYILLVSLS